MAKAICKVVFELGAIPNSDFNSHVIIDCPKCSFWGGKLKQSPIKNDDIMREDHEARLKEDYTSFKAKSHLVYLNSCFFEHFFLNVEKSCLELTCPKCKEEYKITADDYLAAVTEANKLPNR